MKRKTDIHAQVAAIDRQMDYLSGARMALRILLGPIHGGDDEEKSLIEAALRSHSETSALFASGVTDANDWADRGASRPLVTDARFLR